MGEIWEYYTDGIKECPYCKSKKVVVEITSYMFVDLETNSGREGDETDSKITCQDCEKEINEE